MHILKIFVLILGSLWWNANGVAKYCNEQEAGAGFNKDNYSQWLLCKGFTEKGKGEEDKEDKIVNPLWQKDESAFFIAQMQTAVRLGNDQVLHYLLTEHEAASKLLKTNLSTDKGKNELIALVKKFKEKWDSENHQGRPYNVTQVIENYFKEGGNDGKFPPDVTLPGRKRTDPCEAKRLKVEPTVSRFIDDTTKVVRKLVGPVAKPTVLGTIGTHAGVPGRLIPKVAIPPSATTTSIPIPIPKTTTGKPTLGGVCPFAGATGGGVPKVGILPPPMRTGTSLIAVVPAAKIPTAPTTGKPTPGGVGPFAGATGGVVPKVGILPPPTRTGTTPIAAVPAAKIPTAITTTAVPAIPPTIPSIINPVLPVPPKVVPTVVPVLAGSQGSRSVSAGGSSPTSAPVLASAPITAPPTGLAPAPLAQWQRLELSRPFADESTDVQDRFDYKEKAKNLLESEGEKADILQIAIRAFHLALRSTDKAEFADVGGIAALEGETPLNSSISSLVELESYIKKIKSGSIILPEQQKKEIFETYKKRKNYAEYSFLFQEGLAKSGIPIIDNREIDSINKKISEAEITKTLDDLRTKFKGKDFSALQADPLARMLMFQGVIKIKVFEVTHKISSIELDGDKLVSFRNNLSPENIKEKFNNFLKILGGAKDGDRIGPDDPTIQALFGAGIVKMDTQQVIIQRNKLTERYKSDLQKLMLAQNTERTGLNERLMQSADGKEFKFYMPGGFEKHTVSYEFLKRKKDSGDGFEYEFAIHNKGGLMDARDKRDEFLDAAGRRHAVTTARFTISESFFTDAGKQEELLKVITQTKQEKDGTTLMKYLKVQSQIFKKDNEGQAELQRNIMEFSALQDLVVARDKHLASGKSSIMTYTVGEYSLRTDENVEKVNKRLEKLRQDLGTHPDIHTLQKNGTCTESAPALAEKTLLSRETRIRIKMSATEDRLQQFQNLARDGTVLSEKERKKVTFFIDKLQKRKAALDEKLKQTTRVNPIPSPVPVQ